MNGFDGRVSHDDRADDRVAQLDVLERNMGNTAKWHQVKAGFNDLLFLAVFFFFSTLLIGRRPTNLVKL
jgi:hypothetical protein